MCHASWLLIETGIAKGPKMTSFKSIKTDVSNAGGKWEDSEVVVDQGVITSRNPRRLEAFSAKIIEEVQGRPPYPAQRSVTAMRSTKLAGDAGAETRVVILESGEEAFAALTKFANDAGITAASLTAIGAFENAVVGWFDFEKRHTRKSKSRSNARS